MKKFSTKAGLIAAIFTALAGFTGCNQKTSTQNAPVVQQTQPLTQGATDQATTPLTSGATQQK